uniref:Putative secreted protein n=1 Tax=Ixodes ricinus TaxID=34613 RepID=A0A6B0UMF8_IXORI
MSRSFCSCALSIAIFPLYFFLFFAAASRLVISRSPLDPQLRWASACSSFFSSPRCHQTGKVRQSPSFHQGCRELQCASSEEFPAGHPVCHQAASLWLCSNPRPSLPWTANKSIWKCR